MIDGIRIVFFGTSKFAVPALEALVRSGMGPVLVVTAPDAPVGRKQILSPSPVKVRALELGLEVFQPATLKNPAIVEQISASKPEVGVLAAYGKIIPRALIDAFPKGILNVHPSLLPCWRGPTPIQAAILAGDGETGVTIILMDGEVDHGPILAQRKLEIRDLRLETYESLHEKLAALGAKMLVEIFPKWIAGELSPAPQDHAEATFCRKFSREDARIDWAKPAQEIERMVRALNPEPGTYIELKSSARGGSAVGGKNAKVKIVKILATRIFQHSQECENVVPGGMCRHDGNAVVRCGEGALVLERVQPEGKKPMSGADFLRGLR